MITLEMHVGRLIEIRFQPPITAEDASRFIQKTIEVGSVSSTRTVIIVDLSAMKGVLPAMLADPITENMRRRNTQIERQAFLLPQVAVTRLQVERMIRESQGTPRRTFQKEEELFDWLSECLNPAERDRLRTYLLSNRKFEAHS